MDFDLLCIFTSLGTLLQLGSNHESQPTLDASLTSSLSEWLNNSKMM